VDLDCSNNYIYDYSVQAEVTSHSAAAPEEEKGAEKKGKIKKITRESQLGESMI